MVELRVLGGVDLRADDGRELHAFLAQPKRLALLAYLCIASPRGFHRRDALLGIFWPNADESHARNSLRNAVHVIRRALGDDALLVRGAEELAANRDVIACDACEFTDAAQQGAVHEAVAGYRGDLLPGYFIEGAPAFERWLEEERARLRGMAVRAARLCADRLATSGNLSGAVRVARRGAELAEDDERVVRRLIELLAETGDRASALNAYAAFARRLADEYDATPSAETELLARRLRTPIEDADVVAAQRHYTAASIAASAPAAGNDPQPHATPAFPSIPGYVLESELARGGTSTVYLARDRKHQRTVAIKILRADVAAVIGTSRFLAEINVAARLRHEHIVPLFDSGTAGDLPYFVMPCIEGETLRERLHREQRLPMADALHILRDVAEALDYAHAQGISHGDIKPENILLAPGHALVADFGVAQALERAGGQEFTKRAFVAGTPRYTSPEVASGAVRGDTRSDVYSLACVLHEALGGAPPVAASDPRMHRAGSAKGLAAAMRAGRLDVPRALARLIQQALSIAPSERFATAGEFAARASAAGVRRSPFRSAGIAAGAALTLVAAVTLGVTLLGSTRHRGSTSGASALVRRQLTFTGTPMLSALSEDGAYLAYVVPDGDSESVFVSDLAGGVARKLAVVSFVNSVEWSPDGTRILVGSDNRAIVVPRGGGSARSVPIPPRFEVAVHAYWLPDGRRISVHGNMSRRIVVIDLRSGDTVAIPLRDRFIMFEGAWSPDGRAFAVATEDSTREQLRVLSMDGRATIVVDDTIGIASPRWSPAGDAIYYARGHESIWRVPVSIRTHVATGPPEEIHRFLEMLPNHDGHSVFSLAQHGLSMAYTRGLRFANLWSISGDDSGASRPAQLTSGTARIGSPAVSPDGRTIAFVEAVEDNRELFRMPVGGGTPTRITFGAGVGSQGIAWSPDGRQIAFISTRAQRRPLIADAITGRLVDPGGQSEGWGAIAWAPGTRIAFQSRGNRNIVLLDPRTGREERLLPDDTSGWYFAPRYSPDGRRLAVNANLPGGDFGISIFDLTARSMARIRTPVMFPRGWSADGRYVYAIGLRSIYRVDTHRPTAPEPVLTLPWREPDCAPARPLSPVTFVCSASDYTSDVWMIENFDSGPGAPSRAGRTR
jgi:serine/threonine-protein kinase